MADKLTLQPCMSLYYFQKGHNQQVFLIVFFLFSPGKYDTELVEGQPAFYNIRMKLRIHNVSVADFGTYRCMAKNSQGQTTGDIELYGNFYRHAI